MNCLWGDPTTEKEFPLIDAAAEAGCKYYCVDCGWTITDIYEQYGMVPKALVQAALMLVAQSYQHREPSSPQNMSFVLYAFDQLLKPYMKLTT